VTFVLDPDTPIYHNLPCLYLLQNAAQVGT